ncbi:MAG: hypothetical protein KDA89_18495, partial [Planctomycetaceae bacterium]|nr:hypothetical protein [Planctomycetaceae bacterium]
QQAAGDNRRQESSGERGEVCGRSQLTEYHLTVQIACSFRRGSCVSGVFRRIQVSADDSDY